MKNKILIIAALGLAISASAQSRQTTLSDDKLASMYRNVDGSHFSVIKEEWDHSSRGGLDEHLMAPATANDYFCLQHDKMYVVMNGTSTCITTYFRLQDGSMVMPSGAVISSTGKIVHLKNGEKVDINGNLTCSPKAISAKEQAQGLDN